MTSINEVGRVESMRLRRRRSKKAGCVRVAVQPTALCQAAPMCSGKCVGFNDLFALSTGGTAKGIRKKQVFGADVLKKISLSCDRHLPAGLYL